MQYDGEQARLQTEYGNISAASVGAIQRGLVTLEQEGGARSYEEYWDHYWVDRAAG